MKFLVLGNIKDTFSNLPPEVNRQLLEETAVWMYRYRSANILAEIHMLVGCKRFVAVCNSETNVDLMKELSTLPILNYTDIEVYPLADITESINSLIENTKQFESITRAGAG